MFSSLCFLSFNRPTFIHTAITTAVENAGSDVEVIVHDDGSNSDDVVDCLRELQIQGYISTIIANRPGHNEGQGIALNRMFGMAKGDYIVKLDQDLVFAENWLAKSIEILRKDSCIGLLGLFRYEHDPVDYRKTRLAQPRPVDNTYALHTHICGSGFIVPRGIYEEIGPFVERSAAFSEDWEFQREVAGWGYYNALPIIDLVRNVGFGIGPSTIVSAGNVITKIKDKPFVIHQPFERDE